jgi:hypothetical protein
VSACRVLGRVCRRGTKTRESVEDRVRAWRARGGRAAGWCCDYHVGHQSSVVLHRSLHSQDEEWARAKHTHGCSIETHTAVNSPLKTPPSLPEPTHCRRKFVGRRGMPWPFPSPQSHRVSFSLLQPLSVRHRVPSSSPFPSPSVNAFARLLGFQCYGLSMRRPPRSARAPTCALGSSPGAPRLHSLSVTSCVRLPRLVSCCGKSQASVSYM